jgi:membrane protease YdiL (CAAX protease family)
MQCPRCQHENPPGMKFCGECAASLASTCPTCGAAFGVLRTRCRLIVALLVTNIWFAAMHLDSQVLGFFLFGVVLTLLYQRMRSLAAAMAAHAAFNTIAVLATILDVPG